jgi:protease-4
MLLRLLGNFFRLLVLPLALFRRRRVLRAGGFVHVTLEGRVHDIAPEPRFWERWRPRPTSLVELARLVDAVVNDPRARGMLVTLRSLEGGMASATSLRGVLGRVTAAKKDLVVHLPLGGDTKEMYVASAATLLYAGPQVTLAPLGFASAVQYVKRALERAGVEPEVYARGRFKSAGEQLVRDAMSDPQREQVGALLDTFYDEVVDAIARGRNMTPEQARAAIDAAPYLGAEAEKAGLIDGVAYEDEIPGLLGKDGKRPKIVSAQRYDTVMRAPNLKPLRAPGVVAVVRVHGPIASQSRMFQAGATDERVISAVRFARTNRRIAAVVLHVDSPGGGALASDRIHHEIEQLAAEKPLVAYFANVAASGGYYVAAAAHTIVAQPTTITGSIGVVAARFVVEPLLAKLGISTEVLKRGAHADMLQPTRHLSAEEASTFQRELEGMYRAFVGVVARGRKQSVEAIERVAEGRVWSGVDAAREGLVDVLGGFDVACARARELAEAKIGGARAKKLEARIVRGGRDAGPPLDPPAKAAALFERLARRAGIVVPVGMWLATGHERVLAWSELAGELGDDAGDS